MTSPVSLENSAKRRKVRKGTRSCWSCKRRKVRCIFSSPVATVCITCQQRGTKCVSQEVFDPDIPEEEEKRNHTAPDDETPVPIQTTCYSHIQGHTGLPTPESVEQGPLPARSLDANLQSTTEALIRRLPRQQDLDIILRELSQVCLSFYSAKLRIQQSKRKVAPITSQGLRCPQSHPVLLARQMLLLAVGMQHCCFNISIPGLAEHPRIIADSLARSAIELVTSNDLLLDGVESVDNVVLASCYYTNKGDMRQAWLALRRAVMVAQMLRLGESPTEEPIRQAQSDLDGSVVWSCCQGMERLVSVLVSLPTGLPLSETNEISGLPAIAKSMAARIIKRNCIVDPQRALEATFEINSELLKISEELSTLNRTGSDLTDGDADIQTVFHNLCLQSMVLQLHTPYMLFAFDAIRRTHSTVACVHAARELLTRQMELMRLNPIHPCGGMSVFMASIAGIVLMLAHIIGHTSGSMDNLIALQRSSDRELLHTSLDRIQSLSAIEEGSMVSKCLRSLRTCMNNDALAAKGQVCRVKKLPSTTSSRDVTFSRILIDFPAAGRTITLTREGSTGISGRGPPLVIGGIGVLQTTPEEEQSVLSETTRLNTAQSPDGVHEQQNADVDFDVTHTAGGAWPQQDSLDQDWLVDGFFDTSTFFDAFARGYGDLQTTEY